ncbi:MAG: hypothetical protein M3281_02875, partial [Chloroflexota bacterium]|nr:hypothetical protein [Chloroflexota bacterium]
PSPYAPMNWLRLATGLLAGAAVAAYFLPVVNTLVWAKGSATAIFPTLRSVLSLLLWLNLFWAAIALGLDVMALPVALITAAASVTLFGCLNLLFLVLVTRRENRVERASQLLRPALVCAALAVGELLALVWVVHGVLAIDRM